ncbi:unnamed protein product, partial [Prorocentrum cordatum]
KLESAKGKGKNAADLDHWSSDLGTDGGKQEQVTLPGKLRSEINKVEGASAVEGTRETELAEALAKQLATVAAELAELEQMRAELQSKRDASHAAESEIQQLLD